MGSGLLENYEFPVSMDSDVPPDGCCDLAGPKLFEGSVGRRCKSDGSACFDFSDSQVYVLCPTRKKTLTQKKP
jgi:hypothetical protein